MADVARVQSKLVLGSGSGSIAASFDTLPAIGNLAVAHYGYGSSTTNQASISDNQSHSYTEIIEAVSTDAGDISALYAEVVNSAGTFTITGSQGVTSADGLWIAEYENVDVASPIDGTPGVQQTTGFATTAISVSAGTASRGDNMLVLGMRLAATGAIGFTAGTVTERDAGTSGTAGQYKHADDLAGAAGAKTATGTLASGDSVAALAYMLKGVDTLPVITLQPVDGQVVADGGTISFDTTVTGATSYQWQVLTPLSSTWASVSGGSGGTTADYTTPTLSRASDAGSQWRLKASNAFGDTYSNIVGVRITDEPTSYSGTGMVQGVGYQGEAMQGAPEASGGPTTYNESVAETMGLTDLVSSSAQFQSAVAEIFGLVDTVAGGMLYPGSVAETLPLADTPSATMTYPGLASESLPLADTPSATLAAVGSVAESLPLAETVSALISTNDAVAESLPLADAQSGGSVFNESVAETLGLTDSQSSVLAAVGAVAETIPLSDTPGSQISTNDSVSESMALADTVVDDGGPPPATPTNDDWVVRNRRRRS